MERKPKMKPEKVVSNLIPVSKTQCPSSERSDTHKDHKDVPVPQSRKWNEKNKTTKSKTGPLAPEEEVAITDALCEYAFESSLTGEELLSLITDKQIKSEDSIWPKVAECIPERSVQSIHNFCHRKFHPFNYKGGWTESEIKKLLLLVKEHGKKWEAIGKTLERTATNVKDKFKEIGGLNYQTVVKDSNLSLRLKLLKAIDYFLDNNSSHILKYTYKFSSTLDKDFDVLFKLDESANKFLIDSSLKEEKSKVIIRNIFKMLLDFDFITKVYESEIEIPWSAIADRIKFYSAEDCRKEWCKFLKEFNIEERCALKKDFKMIKKIIAMGVETIDDINWDLIKNKRKPNENKVALENYIKVVDIYSVKPFNEILEAIYQEIETTLLQGEEDKEKKEFKRELKERNNRNLIHVYNQFLERKRKHS